MDPVAETLITLVRDVRGRTLSILERGHPEWMTRIVTGTANHMIWHAGHALWVQDVICIEPLTGKSQLPEVWTKRFGQHSQPAKDTGPWPARETMMELLSNQLKDIESILANADPARLSQQDPGMGRHIIHGFHDEAIHQGEMYLLLKIFRADAGK